jgi:hypothetical protein
MRLGPDNKTDILPQLCIKEPANWDEAEQRRRKTKNI